MNQRTAPKPVLQRPGLVQRLLAAHGRAMFDSLGRLWRQPLGSLLSASVIGLTLALPTALHTLVVNLGSVGTAWDESLAMTVLLHDEVDDARGQALADALQDDPALQQVRFLGADKALEEFRQHSGLSSAVDALPENPLPSLLIAVPVTGASSDDIRTLEQRLAALPEADEVLLDHAWLERLHALLDVLRTAVLIFAAALATAVLVIVGNTIRLDVTARREEVEVMKLVGAPDAFIRRPFLYSGFWYGLIGALLALVLVGIGLILIDAPAQRLSSSYDSDFALQGADARTTLLVLLGGCALGWVGAQLAVLRQLRSIEPS